MAILELAIAFPTLIFLVMGAVEFGEFFYTKQAFECAARDAARAAMLTAASTSDPATAATTALTAAGINFNASWLQVVDLSTSTIVNDVSQIPAGDGFCITVQAYYDQIPARCRPLYQMTGLGIKNGKLVLGQCTMVKE